MVGHINKLKHKHKYRKLYSQYRPIKKNLNSSWRAAVLSECNETVYHRTLFTSDKGGGTCFCPCLFVCLSVCLLTRLLKNACMNLDEILRVDRCRDMDELINF